jgi:hypothetical protein
LKVSAPGSRSLVGTRTPCNAVAAAELHLDEPGRNWAHCRAAIAIDPVAHQPQLAQPPGQVEGQFGTLPIAWHHRQHLLVDEPAGSLQVVELLGRQLAAQQEVVGAQPAADIDF